MIEVGLHGTNSFTLVGDGLSGNDSTVSIHTIKDASLRDPSNLIDSYKWVIELVASKGGKETVSAPRETGREGFIRQIQWSLEGLGVEEGIDEKEVLEYFERLHKWWMRETRAVPEVMIAGALSEPEVRWDLIRRMREQIAKDPAAYASDDRVLACLDKVVADLRYVKAMEENDHGNHHNREEDDCPCYTCMVRRSERDA